MCVGAGNTWGRQYCFAMCVFGGNALDSYQIHSCGRIFHGTVEMTDKNMSFMLFKGEDETRPLVDRVENFVRKYSDVVQVWDTRDYPLEGLTPI